MCLQRCLRLGRAAGQLPSQLDVGAGDEVQVGSAASSSLPQSLVAIASSLQVSEVEAILFCEVQLTSVGLGQNSLAGFYIEMDNQTPLPCS